MRDDIEIAESRSKVIHAVIRLLIAAAALAPFFWGLQTLLSATDYPEFVPPALRLSPHWVSSLICVPAALFLELRTKSGRLAQLWHLYRVMLASCMAALLLPVAFARPFAVAISRWWYAAAIPSTIAIVALWPVIAAANLVPESISALSEFVNHAEFDSRSQVDARHLLARYEPIRQYLRSAEPDLCVVLDAVDLIANGSTDVESARSKLRELLLASELVPTDLASCLRTLMGVKLQMQLARESADAHELIKVYAPLLPLNNAVERWSSRKGRRQVTPNLELDSLLFSLSAEWRAYAAMFHSEYSAWCDRQGEEAKTIDQLWRDADQILEEEATLACAFGRLRAVNNRATTLIERLARIAVADHDQLPRDAESRLRKYRAEIIEHVRDSPKPEAAITIAQIDAMLVHSSLARIRSQATGRTMTAADINTVVAECAQDIGAFRRTLDSAVMFGVAGPSLLAQVHQLRLCSVLTAELTGTAYASHAALAEAQVDVLAARKCLDYNGVPKQGCGFCER